MKKTITLCAFFSLLTSATFGQTWSTQVSGVAVNLTGAAFVSTTQGWVAGDNGTILTTIDAGVNWTPQTSGAPGILFRDIFFVDALTGWATGNNGTIVATTDGGANWVTQTSGTTVVLRSVHFVDANNGWTCGPNGTILATTDGGANWVPQTSGTTLTLMSIAFADANNGWCVGTSGATPPGIILHTSDGGANWAPQTAPATNNLSSCEMVSPLLGWVGGVTGVVFNTTDGTSWGLQSTASAGEVRTISALSATEAWACTTNGEIFNTVDAGANWVSQPTGITTQLRGLDMVDLNTGWAAGDGGVILKYEDSLCLGPINVTTTVTDPDIQSNNTNPGVTYQWMECSGDTIIPGATSQVYTATADGQYKVIITEGFCVDTSACAFVDIAGISDNSGSGSVKLYPNPVKDGLNLEFNFSSDCEIQIFNIAGEMVLAEKFSAAAKIANIDLSKLKNGTYMVHIIAGDKVYAEKIVLDK